MSPSVDAHNVVDGLPDKRTPPPSTSPTIPRWRSRAG
jgi:hypothetical protein